MTLTHQNLFAKYSLKALEKQEKLSALIGNHDWNIDVDAGVIIFNQIYNFPIQFLGTESFHSNTWLWMWENDEFDAPEKTTIECRKLKEFGIQNKIKPLLTPQFSTVEYSGYLLSIISSGICDADCFYKATHDDGAVYVLINSQEVNNQKPFDFIKLSQHFNSIIEIESLNHREIIDGYINDKVRDLDTKEKVIFSLDNKDKVIVEFDDQDRVISLSNHA